MATLPFGPRSAPAGPLSRVPPEVWLGGVAFLSALLIAASLGDLPAAGLFVSMFAVTAALLLALTRTPPAAVRALAPAAPDLSLLRAAVETRRSAVAITGRDGRLLVANDGYAALWGDRSPPALPLSAASAERLADAARAAWRDGSIELSLAAGPRGRMRVSLCRAGAREDHLIWCFAATEAADGSGHARLLVQGPAGERLGEAGIAAALVDAEGSLIAANKAFGRRAAGAAPDKVVGAALLDFVSARADGGFQFRREDEDGPALRVAQIDASADGSGGASVYLLLDRRDSPAVADAPGSASIAALLAMVPVGLALTDRDGRFLFWNDRFRAAARLAEAERPIFPSDLVVEEDKSAVADAVRRFAHRSGLKGDVAVRLRDQPDEAVALTVIGARGLGEAAAMLLLKDNTEEQKLKRQIAQATKMQAVGQLAGGVAHDFNNILTAIIGHCDLMLHRHEPGDSDYDDVQQIRSNSNRAASLTRQLLAFSRQQTLRPQLLQLPDVISEVSSLLRRLLGETVRLSIKHGRNLGAVRADPGQLEQVIVNLAVNARDAMPDGGTLTIQTFALPASEVRGLGVEVLPVADYTAMRVTDTGTGIAPELLGKIFEPFFTTKEVGKGTGLGLSTVYGIVKQSGGFIFADSAVGEGTSFVVYLPVHEAAADEAPRAALPKEKPTELWGTGTVLLVEDEAMVRAVAERALTRHGYKVISANDGEQGLELLADGAEVDLLITDVVMPVMDGPTMVRAARATRPELPILFMSGYAEEQLRRSIDIERVHFIAKPFSVQQLAEAARDALAEGAVAE